MRVFKTRAFGRWAGRENVMDRMLLDAIQEMESSLIDAFLGGRIVKKRIAAIGRGKSGSFRTVVAYEAGRRAFYLYGFSKSERDNINRHELETLKTLAKRYFELDEQDLMAAVRNGALLEVKVDE